MRKIIIVCLACIGLWSCKEDKSPVSTEEIVVTGSYKPELKITPISHATFVLEWDGTVFYIDPTGGAEAFKTMPEEDVILVTDIHGDHAFVCMNLPYTMTVEQAASAVLEFQPKEVYPYHYRGTDGFSDVDAFSSRYRSGNTYFYGLFCAYR